MKFLKYYWRNTSILIAFSMAIWIIALLFWERGGYDAVLFLYLLLIVNVIRFVGLLFVFKNMR